MRGGAIETQSQQALPISFRPVVFFIKKGGVDNRVV